MNIIIGISWPFANGELHIGHAASSLPGDIIARYHRLKVNKVILVSGTDCHGTPTEVKALKENKSPKEIVDECHVSFAKDNYLFEEERRLFYVALTRTKSKCILLTSVNKTSTFINELYNKDVNFEMMLN